MVSADLGGRFLHFNGPEGKAMVKKDKVVAILQRLSPDGNTFIQIFIGTTESDVFTCTDSYTSILTQMEG